MGREGRPDPREPRKRRQWQRQRPLRRRVGVRRRALRRLRVRGLQPGGRGDGVQEHLRARPAGPDHDAGEPPVGGGRRRRGRRQELRPRDLGRWTLRRLRLGRRQPVGGGRDGEGRVRPRPPGPDHDPGQPPVGRRGRRQAATATRSQPRSRPTVASSHSRPPQAISRPPPLRSRPTSSCATSTTPRPRSRIARPDGRARRTTPACPPRALRRRARRRLRLRRRESLRRRRRHHRRRLRARFRRGRDHPRQPCGRTHRARWGWERAPTSPSRATGASSPSSRMRTTSRATTTRRRATSSFATLQARTTTLVSRPAGPERPGRRLLVRPIDLGRRTLRGLRVGGQQPQDADQPGAATSSSATCSTNLTALVSRASGAAGAGADGTSDTPAISGDGRLVAFDSLAANLSSEDNDAFDVFARDVLGPLPLAVPGPTAPAGAAPVDTVGPAISARALTHANRTIRVGRDGRFRLFCGGFTEPVTGRCGGASKRRTSAGRPHARPLYLGTRAFRARAGARVIVPFRLSRTGRSGSRRPGRSG